MLTRAQLEQAARSRDPHLLKLVRDYLDAEQAIDAASNFKSFVKLFWPQVATTPLVDGWYLDALTDHLQNLPQIKRLLINIPPRHGKSTLCSVLFPAWFWLTYPSTKFLCASYSLQGLSVRDSIACRSVIESPLYQRMWGNRFKLSTDQNTKGRFNNNHLGFRLATSTESFTLGEGCDVFVGDDLNDVSHATSDAERAKVIHWWTQIMSTRMNPGGLDCKLLIQQRCHEEDITGHVLANDYKSKSWTHLVLPWEYEPSRRCTTSNWQDPRTQDGEPLSTLYPPAKIEELKGGNGLGPTGFATQFQQRPAPASGAMFKKNMFHTYHTTPTTYILGDQKIHKEACKVFVTTDLAVSLKTSADWTVAQAWAVTPHNHLLLLEQFRAKVEAPDILKQFKAYNDRYRPDAVWIETVQGQTYILQLLRANNVPVKPLEHKGQDKKARAQRSLVKAECGHVWLPEGEWVGGWLDEVTQFPNAAKDDQLDAFAWAGIVSARYPCHELPQPDGKTAQEIEAERQAKFMWGGLE